ncbi:MAG: hypothetical protein EBU34_10645 [Alphaproteobacteria bacterium]|nr:hypothetical protein [Alphaproteobacteria bacterium]
MVVKAGFLLAINAVGRIGQDDIPLVGIFGGMDERNKSLKGVLLVFVDGVIVPIGDVYSAAENIE